MSLTIDQWCERHNLSRSTFYKLKKLGKAPRIIKVLEAVRITEDADRQWCAAREAEAVAAA
jgi:predicted DNA-binding transcriptional regulator AlpA